MVDRKTLDLHMNVRFIHALPQYGELAQLGEHLRGTQKAVGAEPTFSTKFHMGL